MEKYTGLVLEYAGVQRANGFDANGASIALSLHHYLLANDRAEVLDYTVDPTVALVAFVANFRDLANCRFTFLAR